jgi:hypothetical protein
MAGESLVLGQHATTWPGRPEAARDALGGTNKDRDPLATGQGGKFPGSARNPLRNGDRTRRIEMTTTPTTRSACIQLRIIKPTSAC